ncbi:MAG TPA: hypothetical protein VFE33_25590 [Thermoanaerobaculia bacterium]|nr:hypothetical protein [Thermoanaerobaculia bacterium]
MSLLVRNHVQPFRPLRGGIAIVSGPNGLFGTLGCVLTSDGQDRWILTAYHVLSGSGTTVEEDVPVFQPALGGPELPVAHTRKAKASKTLDAAAALVSPGTATVNEVLGIGTLARLAEPVPGMRVVKSGIASGVTEGVVVEVKDERARIELPPGYPSKYELSSVSDSGAIWVEQATRSPVALHVAGNDTGTEVALGIRLSRVLGDLRLSLLA